MKDEQPLIGCAKVLILINGALMGLLALTFAGGPYSSAEQEIWYRGGSIGFFIGGAILPGLALAFGAGRSRLLFAAVVAWLVAAMVGWCWYVLMSGGGV